MNLPLQTQISAARTSNTNSWQTFGTKDVTQVESLTFGREAWGGYRAAHMVANGYCPKDDPFERSW